MRTQAESSNHQSFGRVPLAAGAARAGLTMQARWCRVRLIIVLALGGLLLASGLGGCADPQQNGVNGNGTQLQRRYDTLMAEYKQLQLLLAERERQLAQLTGQGGAPTMPAAGDGGQAATDVGPAGGATGGGLQEEADDPFEAMQLSFGRASEAVDADGDGRAEAVRVLVVPQDRDGETVKRSGQLEVSLIDLSGPEPRTVTRQQFSPRQLSQEWVGGLFGSGFMLEMGWPADRRPSGDEVTVRARMITLQGRELTAQRRISLELPELQP